MHLIQVSNIISSGLVHASYVEEQLKDEMQKEPYVSSAFRSFHRKEACENATIVQH